MKKFFLIVTGPHVYLQNGPKIEDFSISQEEIDETREDGESDDDVINYLLEEAVAEWEQRWCQAIVLTEEEFKSSKNLASIVGVKEK